MGERKDGVGERKIEPKPVGNTHPNPVTSTPLGYNAQSAPKGEVEMRKVEMGGHRSLREWANSTSRGWGDRGLAGYENKLISTHCGQHSSLARWLGMATERCGEENNKEQPVASRPHYFDRNVLKLAQTDQILTLVSNTHPNPNHCGQHTKVWLDG